MMPKMTRATFAASIDDIWRLAQNTLARNGTVVGMLIAFDARGRNQVLMQIDSDDPLFARANAITVRGPWHEHLDQIRDVFAQHQAVAAILYTEAWVASDERAAEVLRMNIAVHDHPMKDEILLAVGFWPREFLARGHAASIVRDDRGGIEGLADHRVLDESGTAMFGWLPTLLPQPPGR